VKLMHSEAVNVFISERYLQKNSKSAQSKHLATAAAPRLRSPLILTTTICLKYVKIFHVKGSNVDFISEMCERYCFQTEVADRQDRFCRKLAMMNSPLPFIDSHD